MGQTTLYGDFKTCANRNDLLLTSHGCTVIGNVVGGFTSPDSEVRGISKTNDRTMEKLKVLHEFVQEF